MGMIASKIKMVFAATTNMEDGFQLPKGPLGWLLAAGLGAGEKLNDAAIKFQCSRNPQNYYGPGYCPAAKVYYGKYAGHYNYGLSPEKQGLHVVTIGGVKQLAGPADYWKLSLTSIDQSKSSKRFIKT